MGFNATLKKYMYKIKIKWEHMLYYSMNICWMNEMMNPKWEEKQDKNYGYWINAIL